MLGLGDNQQVKSLKRAIELTRQKAEIERELSELRSDFEPMLEGLPDNRFEVNGVGLAVLVKSTRRDIDKEMLLAQLETDKDFLRAFVKNMVNIKVTNLEKYMGTPNFKEVVFDVSHTQTVRFIEKQ